jgi:hypothetical protein
MRQITFVFSTRHLKLIRAYQLAVMYYGKEEPRFADAVEKVSFAALSLMPLELEVSPKKSRKSSFDTLLKGLDEDPLVLSLKAKWITVLGNNPQLLGG